MTNLEKILFVGAAALAFWLLLEIVYAGGGRWR
jgi:hypothetical protein